MTPLIAAGIELMLVGMGTVFVFLTLLVAATRLMSAVVARLRPETAEAEGEEAADVAAITAAIALHRARADHAPA